MGQSCKGAEQQESRRRMKHTTGGRSRFALRGSLIATCALLMFGWLYSRFLRAQTWLSLIETDLTAIQTLAREGPQAIAPWQPEELLQMTRSDLLALQTEFALPLALAAHLGWVPAHGADLQAAPVLLQAALNLTAVGEEALEPFQPLLAASHDDAAGDEGVLEAGVRTLQDARPGLRGVLLTLEEMRRARQTIRTAHLSPRLSGWVARFDQMLPLLENSVRGAIVLPELLGALEPRTYLILVQNDDELRPTGGFVTGVAQVVVEAGRVVELTFEDSYAVDDLSRPYPEPPQPLREIMGADLWMFRDSNWHPDFPASAQVALELYQLRQDVEVDGVFALDQQALRLFVTALQPLDVWEYPEPLTGDNVIQAVRESWAPLEDEGFTQEWWRRRKEFMGRLLTAAVQRLQDEPGRVNLMELGWAALRALEQRHVFAYVLESGPTADVLHQAGWDGALVDAPGDYLMVVDANLGFNKVNPFVTESISYTVNLRDLTRPQATLTLLHGHTAPGTARPCSHEPRYDMTYEQMMHRCYWDYVRVYVPRESRLLEATPHPVPGSMLLRGAGRTGQAEVLSDEGGRSVFATFLLLGPGEEAETVFVYDLPSTVVEQQGGIFRYRLTVQKQGGTGANALQVAVGLPSGAEVIAASPPPTERKGDVLRYDLRLRTDVALEVHLRAP